MLPCLVLVVLSLVLSAHAGHHDIHQDEHHHSPPHYTYEYKVHDPHTGDIKSQHESRKGDSVKGFYALKEADGSTREVHYTADKHTGFSADVKSSGHHEHIHHAPVHHEPIHHVPVHHATVHHPPVHHAPAHHASAPRAPVHESTVHHPPPHKDIYHHH